jgi:inorganic pyrophosphatase
MEVKPLAILKLIDDGQDDHKILCIPADKKYQTIKANNFNDLNFDYPAIKNIVQLWFENYKGFGKIKTIDWLDEKHAMDEIKKWQRKP